MREFARQLATDDISCILACEDALPRTSLERRAWLAAQTALLVDQIDGWRGVRVAGLRASTTPKRTNSDMPSAIFRAHRRHSRADTRAAPRRDRHGRRQSQLHDRGAYRWLTHRGCTSGSRSIDHVERAGRGGGLCSRSALSRRPALRPACRQVVPALGDGAQWIGAVAMPAGARAGDGSAGHRPAGAVGVQQRFCGHDRGGKSGHD